MAGDEIAAVREAQPREDDELLDEHTLLVLRALMFLNLPSILASIWRFCPRQDSVCIGKGI